MRCSSIGNGDHDGVDRRWLEPDARSQCGLTKSPRRKSELAVEANDIDERQEATEVEVVTGVTREEAFRQHRCRDQEIRRQESNLAQPSAAPGVKGDERFHAARVEHEDQGATSLRPG